MPLKSQTDERLMNAANSFVLFKALLDAIKPAQQWDNYS